MKPPRCAVCRRRFNPFARGPLRGGTVSFRQAPDQPPRVQGEVGHPPHVEWFCWPHIRPARRLSHLTLGEAMRRLRGWRAIFPF